VTPTPIGDEDLIDLDVSPFVYAFQTWDHIRISSNGYLVVGDGTGTAADNDSDSQILPDPAPPNNVIAPFWTNLDGTGTPGIYHAALTDGAVPLPGAIVIWAGFFGVAGVLRRVRGGGG
jgi:hypothetical protein